MNKLSTYAIKIRLLPDPIQSSILDSQSRQCNWLYNHLLEIANSLRDSYRTTQDETIVNTLYSKRGLRNLVPKIKLDHPFLKTVHSSPLKNSALRLSDCIQTYQKSRKGKRKGKETGWPRFRSWRDGWFSLYYDEPNKGFKIEENTLKLSLGTNKDKERLKLSIPVSDSQILKDKKVNNLRIVKQNNEYYAILCVEREMPEKKVIKKIIAFDPNHKNLCYGVNNENEAIEIQSPWWLKRFDKRIDELKAKRDRCKKKSKEVMLVDGEGNSLGKIRLESSKRYKKYSKTLMKVSAKRREQMKTYCYTIANKIVQDHDLILMGDYTPQGNGVTTSMRRAMNNRSLIGRFKQTLSWVAIKSGKYYEEFNEAGTTRTCHYCETVVSGGLSANIREWTCDTCHTMHIRDENAAINGMRKGLRIFQEKSGSNLPSVPSSGLVSIVKRWAWRVVPSGVLVASRGLSGDQITSVKKLNKKRGSFLPEFAHDHV